MINSFIRQFTDRSIGNVVKVGDRYYLADKELVELKDKVKLEPYSIGLFLGADVNGFKPSPALVDEIAKISDKKVFVNDKAENLFLCGRDIFGKSIVKANADKGFVLVQNEKDENLGYGKVVADIGLKDKAVVKNLLDKGSYLRIEMDK